MAVDTLGKRVASGEHVVHFYERESELVDAVAPYLAAGVRAEETVVVIATEAHRRAFAAALHTDGIDLARASCDGGFVALDAATAIAAFVTDGRIDRNAFHGSLGALLRDAAQGGRVVRVYGEMVALLWDAGRVLAAIELETLWNELALELPFALFCAYPTTSVAGAEQTDALYLVCREHSSVLTRSSIALADATADPCREPADPAPRTGVSAHFGAERDSPGHARRLVGSALRGWGCADQLVDDAMLMVSELATNAVRHACSPFSVAAHIQGSTLRIVVEDWTPLACSTPDGGLTPQPLHGLGLVEAMSTRWGVEHMDGGKVVWLELACDNVA
ncbi:MAG TPA: MEDS domain-containing protein [Solirubrobacteraceae bacterium]|jgi:anti-sigma regulatory factor (Ser/Thr protein kinase)|nr:MEDS domain-containing protein [Solirubrobacteraceae bacterium]